MAIFDAIDFTISERKSHFFLAAFPIYFVKQAYSNGMARIGC
jgi:hypothetical protein